MKQFLTILRPLCLIVALLFSVAATSWAQAQPEPQTIVYVDAESTNTSAPHPTTNTGNSWSTAFKFLQSGLDRADQIHQLQGQSELEITIRVRGKTTTGLSYRPDQSHTNTGGTNIRADTFSMRVFVTVRGGYRGNDGTSGDPDDNNPTIWPTILTGEIGNTSSLTDNSYHVVKADGTVVSMNHLNTRLDGFTVRDGFGRLTGTSTSNGGAGILCTNNGNARFVNLVITNNRAGHQVGLEPLIPLDCNNTSGAGVKCSSASPVFINCAIINNRPVDGFLIFGGGLSAVNGGTPTLIACTIRDNRAVFGGGIAVRNTSGLEMINCLVLGNSVGFVQSWNGQCFGGGVSVDGAAGAVSLTNCTFTLNSTNASNIGAGFAQFDTPDDLCTVDAGGSLTTLHNCIFWKNFRAPEGNPAILSQIYREANTGDLEIRRCDVEGELAGISNPVSPPGWSSPAPATVYEFNQDVDPQFISTPVAGETPSPGFNCRLNCNSLCIDYVDNGNGNSLVPVDTFDIDGDMNNTEFTPDRDRRERIVNSVVDQGCYERFTCAGDANADGVVNIDDLLLVITSWGACPSGGAPCPADVFPAVCAGNGTVNIDDLVQGVITNCGVCPGGPGAFVDSIPTSFQECWDKCSENFETGSEDWQTCMDGCILMLCEMGYITEGCE